MGAFGLFTKTEVGMKLHKAEVEAFRQKNNAYDDGLVQGRLEGKHEQEVKDHNIISGLRAAATRYGNLAKRVRELEKIAVEHGFIFGTEVHQVEDMALPTPPQPIDLSNVEKPELIMAQGAYTAPDVLAEVSNAETTADSSVS